jgi:CRP-like cAMP-binding protein
VRPSPPATVTGNQLLDRIPAVERARILEASELVQLAANTVIDEPGTAINAVYFPTASAISSLLPMHGGHVIEVSLIGHEGLHGAAAARGSPVSAVRAEVHLAGPAWRMATPAFRRSLATHRILSGTVDGYMTALLAQLARAAGCNRFHRVEQRVARWILMTGDRVRASTFSMTHEMVAAALGVRRVGVTNAAGHLQRLKLISYGRGVATILDRKGLERASCECYRADLDAYAFAFAGPGANTALRRERIPGGAAGARRKSSPSPRKTTP